MANRFNGREKIMEYHPVLCVVIFTIIGILYVIACKKEGCE